MSSLGKHWKLSKETKIKIGNANRGKKHSKDFGLAISKRRKGKKHSEKTKKKMALNSSRYWLGKRRLDISGEKCHFWRGGRVLLKNKIRSSYKYRQWRSDVFTRDNFTCQECGERGGYLEVHHIKRFSEIIVENRIKTLEEALNCEELWNINNGETLCRKCHNPTRGLRK